MANDLMEQSVVNFCDLLDCFAANVRIAAARRSPAELKRYLDVKLVEMSKAAESLRSSILDGGDASLMQQPGDGMTDIQKSI